MKVKVLKSNNSTEEVDLKINEAAALTDNDVALVSRVRNQALKQGTKHSKTRSEVTGHSAKPFRQKGTGRARQGSTKGPHHVGGGVAHGPKPDFTKLNLNKKYKSLVLKKALVEGMMNDTVKLIELKAGDKELRKSLDAAGKTLVIFSANNLESVKGLRNLANLEVLNWAQLSSFNLLNRSNVLIDIDCQEELVNLLNK
jgi:large subunit ribosomal protein L4